MKKDVIKNNQVLDWLVNHHADWQLISTIKNDGKYCIELVNKNTPMGLLSIEVKRLTQKLKFTIHQRNKTNQYIITGFKMKFRHDIAIHYNEFCRKYYYEFKRLGVQLNAK